MVSPYFIFSSKFCQPFLVITLYCELMTFSYLLSNCHSRHSLSSVLSKFTPKIFHSGVTWGGPPPSSDATVLSGQSTKTNKAASDATIEAGVVTSDGTIYRIVSNIAILRSYRGISLSR